jgi:outer membrane immunogenic protein
MRSIALASMLFLGVATAAGAQALPNDATPSGDVALTYHWVRTNTQPGDCGCFDLNGGGISGSWRLRPRWSAVAEFSGEYAGSGPYPGGTLRLLSYLGGVRYQLPHTWFGGTHALQPFGQMLVGGGHASGALAGAGAGTNAFVARVGGGLDLPLKGGFALRALQADYDVTTFANGVNGHQNNLLLGTGVVYRWSRSK